LQEVRARWRSRSWRRAPPTLHGELDERELKRIGREIRACVDGRESQASVRGRVAQLATTYVALEEPGRLAILSLIADGFGTPEDRATEAASHIVAATTPATRAEAVRAARAVLEPPWVKLLTQLSTLPDGVKFLVDLRADLLGSVADRPELGQLELDLRQLLASWFDVGFLELQRVTWDSPASLLEKLARSEAVHAVSGWDDLKNRLDPDRRFFAFFHPRMPGEPLVFVQVALGSSLAAEIAPLLDLDAPLADVAEADTAIFYSISSVQPGLAGISLGGFLIKQVVSRLTAELPRLHTFATLSPIPGFRGWLRDELATRELQLAADQRAELASLVESSDPGLPPEGSRSHLLQLCADYLLTARRPNRRALDPVANFHLANGARIERINWLADTSFEARQASLGLMVNYLYRLDDIEQNNQSYAADGAIAASSAVEQLARGARKLRPPS
jgi:malonyl-CoA decarboxylase